MEEDTAQNFSLPTVQPATGVAQDVPLQEQQVPDMPASIQPMVQNGAPAGQPQTSQRPSMQQAIAASMPMSAQDQDLIERIWVDKAKMIVRQTYGDPFVQNKALSQVKADYIRKRYGKEIKVSE